MLTSGEEFDRPLFSTSAWVGMIISIFTVILALSWHNRESTREMLIDAVKVINLRYDDLSRQHDRTFQSVLALYDDLDERLDRIEAHVFGIEPAGEEK